MIPINRTYAPIQAFVDELARCGTRHAVTSPGSRNAPLALVLAAEPRIEAHSVVDERAAGFVALGLAKASGLPVAVTCTSGTAVANLMPAVVEAHEARVPLVVLTADRPPELRDVGAGQAIDQIRIYGRFAKWFVEVGNHDPSRATAIHFRALACRAYATARGGRPGPVHLNFPLREPLAPLHEDGLDAADWDGRDGERPWVTVDEEPRAVLSGLSALPRRTAVVAGPLPGRAVRPLAGLAAAAGWPLLADATSGLRRGGHDRSAVVAHYDVLLRDERFAAEHTPELVVRIGDTPTSKPLRAWLAATPEQLVVDAHADWHEPTRRAGRIVRADAASWCAAVEPPAPHPDWLEGWRDADARVPPALDDTPDPFEPKVWNAVAGAAQAGASLWVASSMPIRDVEAFLPAGEKPLRVLANRGANGIDGTVASAAGAALAQPDARTFVLIGDVALLHDVGGLLAAARLGTELTVVCANNGGGGIFDFLPVAGAADPRAYEEHVATPTGLDLARLAALADMPYTLAGSLDELRAACERPGLVEVRTDRARNVEAHRELYARVHRDPRALHDR